MLVTRSDGPLSARGLIAIASCVRRFVSISQCRIVTDSGVPRDIPHLCQSFLEGSRNNLFKKSFPLPIANRYLSVCATGSLNRPRSRVLKDQPLCKKADPW